MNATIVLGIVLGTLGILGMVGSVASLRWWPGIVGVTALVCGCAAIVVGAYQLVWAEADACASRGGVLVRSVCVDQSAVIHLN